MVRRLRARGWRATLVCYKECRPMAPEDTTLFQDSRMVLTREQQGRIIRFRRTSVQGDVEWLERIIGRLDVLIARSERGRFGLLIDTREAPPAADPQLEASLRASAERFSIGYRKRAVLVRTALGKLQMGRINRERVEQGIGPALAVFDNEKEAIAYLLSL